MTKKQRPYNIFMEAVKIPSNSTAANLLLKPPKEKEHPHINIPQPHMVYQADLLYLPTDDTYKYALVIVDVATGITDLEPLKTHSSKEVAQAFKIIFKRKILPVPIVMIQLDKGTEFRSAVKKYFDKE